MAYAKGKAPKTREQELAEINLMTAKKAIELGERCLVAACAKGIPTDADERQALAENAFELGKAFVNAVFDFKTNEE